MRRVPLLVLALVLVPAALAPAALAHGSHGLHLRDVQLSYAPVEAGQALRFVVENDPTGDAERLKAHVALRDAMMRETFDVGSLASGESGTFELVVPLRAAPRACLVVTSGLKSTEEVCVFATTAPAVAATG